MSNFLLFVIKAKKEDDTFCHHLLTSIFPGIKH